MSMHTFVTVERGLFDDNLLVYMDQAEWSKKSFWLSTNGAIFVHCTEKKFLKISMPLGMLFRSSGQ